MAVELSQYRHATNWTTNLIPKCCEVYVEYNFPSWRTVQFQSRQLYCCSPQLQNVVCSIIGLWHNTTYNEHGIDANRYSFRPVNAHIQFGILTQMSALYRPMRTWIRNATKCFGVERSQRNFSVAWKLHCLMRGKLLCFPSNRPTCIIVFGWVKDSLVLMLAIRLYPPIPGACIYIYIYIYVYTVCQIDSCLRQFSLRRTPLLCFEAGIAVVLSLPCGRDIYVIPDMSPLHHSTRV